MAELGGTLLSAHVGWVLVTFALINISLFVRAYRWRILLHGLGVDVPLGRLTGLYFVGNFFNAFLPTSFGGDVVRIVEVANDVPSDIAAGTVIVDRLTGLLTLFAMALVMFPFRPADFPPDILVLVVTVCVAGLAAGLILLHGGLLYRLDRWLPSRLSPTEDNSIGRVLRAVSACGWRAVGSAMLVSLVFNLILTTWWWTAGKALDLDISFRYYLLVIPLLSISLLIPSIGGLGPRETVAPELFAARATAGQAVALSLLVYFLQRLSGIVGGFVYLVMILQNRAPRREPVVELAAGDSDSTSQE